MAVPTSGSTAISAMHAHTCIPRRSVARAWSGVPTQSERLQTLLRAFIIRAEHRPEVVVCHPSAFALSRDYTVLSHVFDDKENVFGIYSHLCSPVVSDSSQKRVAFGIEKILDFRHASRTASKSSSITRGLEFLTDVCVRREVESVTLSIRC